MFVSRHASFKLILICKPHTLTSTPLCALHIKPPWLAGAYVISRLTRSQTLMLTCTHTYMLQGAHPLQAWGSNVKPLISTCFECKYFALFAPQINTEPAEWQIKFLEAHSDPVLFTRCSHLKAPGWLEVNFAGFSIVSVYICLAAPISMHAHSLAHTHTLIWLHVSGAAGRLAWLLLFIRRVGFSRTDIVFVIICHKNLTVVWLI